MHRLVRPVLALLTAAIAVTGLTAVPNAAAAAVPTVPQFGPAIDPYASYEAERGCDPTEKPGTAALRSLVVKTYGSSIATNIVRSCSASESGHEEGRSLDWMTNARNAAQRDIGDTFVEWLRATDAHGNQHAMARRLGVMYIIWNNKMWRAYDPDRADTVQPAFTGGWTTFSTTVNGVRTPCTATAASGTAYDNSCHRNHVHISLSWDGAMGRTTYYAYGRPGTECATPKFPGYAPALATVPLGYVPVASTRVLSTSRGTGVLNPCRIGPGRHVDVQVAGVGAVPASNVAAVVVNVVASKPTATTAISAFPAGTTFPKTYSLALGAAQTRSALVVVPVGANGRISLRNESGATNVLADVVGYYPKSGGESYVAATRPVRLLDTRRVTPLVAATPRKVPVRGVGGVSTKASVAVLNVTAVRPSAAGYVAVTAATPSRAPRARQVTFQAGGTVGNRVYAPIGADGTVTLWPSVGTHAVVAVVGWFTPTAEAGATRFVPLSPRQLLDTRITAAADTFSGANDTELVTVAGRAGVPSTARSVVVTLSGFKPSVRTDIVAFPAGAQPPRTVDLSMMAAEAQVSNLAVVPLGTDGMIAVRNGTGPTDLGVDVVGYHR